MSEIKFRPFSSLNLQMRNTFAVLVYDMLTYYGHIKGLK